MYSVICLSWISCVDLQMENDLRYLNIHKGHPPRSFDFYMFHCFNITKHISTSVLFFCWIFENNCPGGGGLPRFFCPGVRVSHFLCARGSSPFQKIPQGGGQAWNWLVHNSNNNNSTFSVWYNLSKLGPPIMSMFPLKDPPLTLCPPIWGDKSPPRVKGPGKTLDPSIFCTAHLVSLRPNLSLSLRPGETDWHCLPDMK